MSFKNAAQSQYKFIRNYVKNQKPFGLLASVLAARGLNRLIQETDFVRVAGKKRKVVINFYPPVCNDTGSCSDNICNPGVVQELIQREFDITRCTASAVYQLNKEDIRMEDSGWSFSEHAKQQIAAAMETVRQKLEADLAGIMVDAVGVFPDGQPTKLLPVVNKNTGEVNPVGLWELERIFMDAGMTAPFIVGARDVMYWQKAVEIGGMNNLGQNVAQMGRTNAYYDSIINTTFADGTHEHILAFDPNLIKFIAYSENAGMFATNMTSIEDIDRMYADGAERVMNGSILDPVSGLLYDLDVHWDTCDKNWKFQWKILWDLIQMPLYNCQPEGVTGVFHFETCLPLVETCENTTPVSPVATSTYNWSLSGMTYPYRITDFTLGTAVIHFNEAVEIANNAGMVAFLNANYENMFTLNASNARYQGFAGLIGTLNGGSGVVGGKDITFA